MFEKVKEIIVKETGVDAEKVTMTAAFKEDLGIDSLDIFEMVMTFEDELGVEISNEDLENISTVGQFVEYLEKIS